MTDTKLILSESEAKAIRPITVNGRMIGTCFHVYREEAKEGAEGKSYFLTALHVLDEAEKVGTPTVDGALIRSRLSHPDKESLSRYENDLALVEIAELPDEVGVLPLSDDLAANQSVTLWGHSLDPAAPRYFRFHGVDTAIRGSVGFLGQATGIGEHGLGINFATDQRIPGGFSGGPVYDSVTKAVLGVTVSRQRANSGDAVRTLGVARLLEFTDKYQEDIAGHWKHVVNQIAPVFAIPAPRSINPLDTRRLRQYLNVSLVVLFFCATVSIWVAYKDAPLAWKLQFDYLKHPTCSGIPIGWIIEIVFTAIFLVIARAMLVRHFPDDLTRVVASIFDLLRSREQLTTAGLMVLIAGFVLFLSTIANLWAYHTNSAPANLEQWAKAELHQNKKDEELHQKNKYDECPEDIKDLQNEVDNQPLLAYREVYLRYFLYSFVNFGLIAVPLAVVLAIASARDMTALLSLNKRIRNDQQNAGTFEDAREWFYLTRTMRGPFQDYRLHSEQIVRRSLITFALFSPLVTFSAATSNLAASAFAYAVLAAFIIFVGPLFCIVTAIICYGQEMGSLQNSITQSRTLSIPEKEQRLQEFRKAYGDRMWTTLWEDKFTVIGALLYVLILMGVLIYWQLSGVGK